jgi:hypothetical protein
VFVGRDRVIFALLFFGFAVLGLDARYEHRHVVGEHWQGWIPVAACGLSALASLMAMGQSRAVALVCTWVFGLSAVAGLYGVALHTELEPEVVVKMLRLEALDEQAPPALAPLGLTGLASIGLVLASGGRKSKKG